MLASIYRNTDSYILAHPKSSRKDKGQFFTSKKSAQYMASLIQFTTPSVSILDPGAGNGALTAAVIEAAANAGICKKIRAVFYETDRDVLPVLTANISAMREFCEARQLDFDAEVITDNFILADTAEQFDIVICNPPYKKIRKDSAEARKLSHYVHGQPNLYGLFMAKAADLLKQGGQYVFIVPRSWTSGAYFQKIRSHIFDTLSIDTIHIFNNREKAFSGEDVLQETMILWATKREAQGDSIKIVVSSDDTYSDINEISSPADALISRESDGCLLVPSNQKELEIIEKMHGLSDSFDSLGYVFKTGPVVEFRSTKDISVVPSEDKQIPMFRSANISEGKFTFPVQNGKAQYVSGHAKKLLIPNETTVLVKRLSAKEESKRLQSCVYAKQGTNSSISIENHVNYLVRKDGKPIQQWEAERINALLSSDEYDMFFRISNGSTQVNASDLNYLPVRRADL